jgi:hypothetical protein
MWIFTGTAFVSIVRSLNRKGKKDLLLVRGRVAGDIQRLFPDAKVRKTPNRDYLFRAYVPREEVARVLAQKIMAIDYGLVGTCSICNETRTTRRVPPGPRPFGPTPDLPPTVLGPARGGIFKTC